MPGACLSKSPKTFWVRKAIRDPRSAYSEKLVFEHVFKPREIKTIAKFHDLKRFVFEDTKRFMSPEIRSKSFGTFDKHPPGPRNFQSRRE